MVKIERKIEKKSFENFRKRHGADKIARNRERKNKKTMGKLGFFSTIYEPHFQCCSSWIRGLVASAAAVGWAPLQSSLPMGNGGCG